MSKIIERVSFIIDNKGISVRAFELSIGASNGTIARAISKGADIGALWLSRIIEKYPYVNAEWLLSGKGDVFKDINTDIPSSWREFSSSGVANKNQTRVVYDENNNVSMACEPKAVYEINSPNYPERQRIPIYKIEDFSDLASLLNESCTKYAIDYMSVSLMPKCEGGIRITGYDMYPLLKSGDIVLYNRVNNIAEGIMWGEMYLLSIDIDGNEYVMVKYIQKSELPGHVKLVSHCKDHEDKDILLKCIKALAYIKASIRINTSL